ncbi:aspartate kinase [Longirhabdus pacifica]|uniref:aspartate kinase n=1 Tax=Longirhabdus pacifica TaxID=2305227 RepID=UPI001008D1E7|nr:aspartate kinase [Longirhabdus pacifica]
MKIIVQKFGGTSLQTKEARSLAVEHIQNSLKDNYHVVVVVSAMGRKGDAYATDTLLQLSRENGGMLPARETDLLLSCGEVISATVLCSMLIAEQIPATVLTGAQAGIITNGEFSNAQIVTIQTNKMMSLLESNKVVIVTGFQGKADNDDIATLGRGASDTSATALGAALKADYVDIFTDVNGILSADPKIVKDARALSQVSYAEICHMAQNGAKVIHPRAVELAMHANIPIRVRSTFSKDEGTLVTYPEALTNSKVSDRYVTGIASVDKITQIQINAKEGQYDLQLKVFKAMAQNQISVDFINVTPSGVVYTIQDEFVSKADEVLKALGYEAEFLPQCAKISVIGGGINGVPGIMARIVEALTEVDIQILQSADSNTTIWVLVRGEHMKKAICALHDKFSLHLVEE